MLKIVLLLILIVGGKSPFSADLKESKVKVEKVNDEYERLDLKKYLHRNNLYILPEWDETPVVGKYLKLNLEVKNIDGELIDVDPAKKLFVKVWMPSMGHGSFAKAVVTRVSKGKYQASKIFFTMDGYWDVHIQILSNNRVDEEYLWPIEF